jgi:hypothetical protein
MNRMKIETLLIIFGYLLLLFTLSFITYSITKTDIYLGIFLFMFSILILYAYAKFVSEII